MLCNGKPSKSIYVLVIALLGITGIILCSYQTVNMKELNRQNVIFLLHDQNMPNTINTWPSKAQKDAYFSFCWHF